MEVSCPNCNQTVKWSTDARWKPFCSERCRMIDLGDWIDEKHRICEQQSGKDFVPLHDDDLNP